MSHLSIATYEHVTQWEKSVKSEGVSFC